MNQVTPASLIYPLSVFNKNSTLKSKKCKYNPTHMPRLLPIYISISHLPPTSHTLMSASKYTYMFPYILRHFYSNLLFPHVFSYVQIPAGCVFKHVYAFLSTSIFIHTYRHPHMYGLCSVVRLSPSSCFLCSVSTNFIHTYVTVPIDGRTTWKYAYPLFPSVSSFL